MSSAQLEMDVDHLSNMPDEVLLKILSLLPTIEATSTAILSKRWRYLPRYLHVLDFDMPCVRSENFVSQTLMLHHPSVDIKRFRLNFHWDGPWCLKLDIHSQVDQWLATAVLYNVQELDLVLWKCSFDLYHIIYQLPPCVFRSDTVTCLRLSYCKLNALGVRGLVSLKVLIMKDVFIENETMRILITRCLLLEVLRLVHCMELESLEGYNASIRYLEILSCPSIQNFNMQVPNLQTFKFYPKFADVEIIKRVANRLQMPGFAVNFGRLVTLSLTAGITNDTIQLLMLECHLLENLSLRRCMKLKQLNIISRMLKRFNLVCCFELNKIEIDAPNLVVFDYVGKEIVEVAQMNTNCLLAAKLDFIGDGLNEDIQHDKLKSFLERFNHVKAITLVSGKAAERVLIPEDILQDSLPPLYHLKELTLRATSTKKSYKQVLIDLLSLSVHLEVLTVDLIPFLIKLKFRPEISTDLEDFPNLDWSFLPRDHLQRRLVEAEIKNMRGDRREKELVEFLSGEAAISDDTYIPMKNWIWKA